MRIIQKINWRQILIHFVGAIFFMLAFQIWAYLWDTTLYEALRVYAVSGRKETDAFFVGKNYSPTQLIVYFFYCSFGWVCGMLIALVMSLAIALKRKWWLGNTLFVLLMVFILSYFWSMSQKIDLLPVRWFENTFIYLFLNGLLWFGFGLLVFLYKSFNDFIERGVKKPTEPVEGADTAPVLQKV